MVNQKKGRTDIRQGEKKAKIGKQSKCKRTGNMEREDAEEEGD